MDAARWTIVGIVLLMMCSTLGVLYKLNKQVLYVYEDEVEKVAQPKIIVAPIETVANVVKLERTGPMPSFAFMPIDDVDAMQQFKQGDERRKGLVELTRLATVSNALVPKNDEGK